VLRLRRTGRTRIIAEPQRNGDFSLADRPTVSRVTAACCQGFFGTPAAHNPRSQLTDCPFFVMIGIGVRVGNNHPRVMSRLAARARALRNILHFLFAGFGVALFGFGFRRCAGDRLVCRMEARLRPVIHESLQEPVVSIGRRDVR
jgi:hypothetical protein